ncbi:class D beta-lactamase [Rhizosphaericola mali]|uniref:Beta-lactamase n=1 Tax=Rhizosphaericola mali TaxID=2545455 RepID=A0A5P2FXV0_9BACT|nr:class D beta-lactamase [Rhizosphaericola mali]QES87767.1 class D beta-lactamase [Rhizosphaericola mali]
MRLVKFLSFLLVIITLSSCQSNNVTIKDEWSKYFKDNGVEGSFALYDNGHDQFDIYDLDRYKDSAYLPASTFKIVNSLIGIETGAIDNERMIIKWDGIHRRPEWDKDLTMEQAFKVSAVPYYQEVARRIGKDTMQNWLDTLHYGSTKITSKIDTFWLDNSLKITADEQLGLVKRLYFEQLPFQKRTINIVKKVMVQQQNSNYILAYKTGLGFDNGRPIGWVVGWIEENKHPYFFVLNIEGQPGKDISATRLKILNDILNNEGLFKGDK